MAAKDQKRRLIPRAVKKLIKLEENLSGAEPLPGPPKPRTLVNGKAKAPEKPKGRKPSPKPTEPAEKPAAKKPVMARQKHPGGRPRKEVTARRPVGRPGEYSPKLAERAKRLCLLGLTNDQIADSFGITGETVRQWRLRYPEFAAALDFGREHADAVIANSLFQRAKGYRHRAVKIFKPKDEAPTKVSYVEHYPPDTAAAVHWLNVRANKYGWKSKSEQAVTGPNGGPIDVRDLTEVEAGREMSFLLGRVLERTGCAITLNKSDDT